MEVLLSRHRLMAVIVGCGTSAGVIAWVEASVAVTGARLFACFTLTGDGALSGRGQINTSCNIPNACLPDH